MEKNDFKRFRDTMKAIGEAFEKIVSPSKIEIYFRALQDLVIEDIEKASWNIINSRKLSGTFPLVAEIRESIQGNPEDNALIALGKVERAIREYGGNYSVQFDDPIIHRIISGHHDGWPGLCLIDNEEWKWYRKDFLKMYQTFMYDQRTPGEIPAILLGLHDHGNIVGGHLVKPEYLKAIGDIKLIEAWVQHREQIANGKEEINAKNEKVLQQIS